MGRQNFSFIEVSDLAWLVGKDDYLSLVIKEALSAEVTFAPLPKTYEYTVSSFTSELVDGCTMCRCRNEVRLLVTGEPD